MNGRLLGNVRLFMIMSGIAVIVVASWMIWLGLTNADGVVNGPTIFIELGIFLIIISLLLIAYVIKNWKEYDL